MWISLSAKRRAQAAKKWPVAPGEIASSQVKQEHRYTAQGYRLYFIPEIIYRYRVNGRDYESRRINFNVAQGVTEAWAQSFVDRYPVGKKVNVSYHPVRPEESVLEHTEVSLIIGWFILIFVVVLFGIIFLANFNELMN